MNVVLFVKHVPDSSTIRSIYINIYFIVILDVLKNDGHKIELKQISYWNVVELYVNGEMVFKCDMRDLDFGKDICIFMYLFYTG